MLQHPHPKTNNINNIKRNPKKTVKFMSIYHSSSCSFTSLPTPIRSSATETPTTPPTTSEIRVCVNRICRRKGSNEILHVLTSIAPTNVVVNSYGCLGSCGIAPLQCGSALWTCLLFPYCATPAGVAGLMAEVCGGEAGEWSKSLEALASRERAGDEMDKSNFSLAESLLTQAIDLKPKGGIHIMYKERSSARIGMGKITEALEDVKEALALVPNYHEAYICQGDDALVAIENFSGAGESYSIALELDPSIRRSKSFKARFAKLQEKFVVAD